MLLYGPPGTGKTLLARAVAHHTDCTFIRVSGSELVQKYIGEGSRMVRELFVMARCGSCSIDGWGLGFSLGFASGRALAWSESFLSWPGAAYIPSCWLEVVLT